MRLWFLGAVMVQLVWKDGDCALDRLFQVHLIERVDRIYPHGKDFQSSRLIRSQEFALSEMEKSRRAQFIELRVPG